MKKKAIGKASDQLALDFDAVSTTTEASGTTQEAQLPDFDGDARICVPSRSSITVEQGIPLTMLALDDAPVMPPRGRSLLAAASDAAAVETWVEARCADEGRERAGRPDHTGRSYRREARRFLLWLKIERGVSLGETRLEDCLAYKQFLSDPQPRSQWCARRGPEIGSPQWRPFEGALGPAAQRQAMTILASMYSFLQDQQYLQGNPWTGVALPRGSAPKVDAARHLSPAQWAAVEAEGRNGSKTPRVKQAIWVARFLRATGLRLAEICSARCDDLAAMDSDIAVFGSNTTQAVLKLGKMTWVINVLGKGMKQRCVPVPLELVRELGERLAEEGGALDPRSHVGRPLVERLPPSGQMDSPQHLEPQALYRRLKQLFANVAFGLRQLGSEADARVLEAASTHWLRHTCGSHSIAAGVPIDVVQQNLGHASLATTTIYCRSEIDRRIVEQARMWR